MFRQTEDDVVWGSFKGGYIGIMGKEYGSYCLGFRVSGSGFLRSTAITRFTAKKALVFIRSSLPKLRCAVQLLKGFQMHRRRFTLSCQTPPRVTF